MASELAEWEEAERRRSAQEASHTHSSGSLESPKSIARYFNPPPDTIYPLEYAFYLLGDVRGKTVLEYGCGDGVNTVLLANRGARVIALDLSPELIEVARQRLRVHGITAGVEFIVGSAHNVPLASESVDVVFGIAILHHLDLQLSGNEVKRLLKKGGAAIFQEPVRNSSFVRTVRKLIPYRSPDISPYERPLTDHELRGFAAGCASYRAEPFTLPTSGLLNRLPVLRRYTIHATHRWDASLLRRFPFLATYSSIKVLKITR